MLIKETKITARILRILKHEYFLLLLLWAILTAINIDKAFHIDDTFHLEASEWIKNNPLHPMSGLINWGDIPLPIHEFNQPPLFFYLIALFTGIFGLNEIPLHLLLSIFTFLGLYYFYKIAKLLLIKNVKTLLVLFAFCPAFIINQNLMTDVPILALIMAFVYFIFKAKFKNKLIYYCIASVILGLGLLIKYSLLPLLIVLLIVLLIRREYKNLVVLLIPITFLFLWSYWNFIEYGSVHILNRPSKEFQTNQLWTFLACLGSISTFSFSLFFGLFPYKIIKRLGYFIIAVFIISIIIFIYGLISEKHYAEYLNNAFIINGSLVFIILLVKIGINLKMRGLKNLITSESFVIFLFFSSISTFIILFAPFIATRHILLVIPFILLLGHELIDKASIKINRLSVIITIILGLLLGISDWKYADYYRQMASVIDLPRDRNIWTVGHWGWQWYSKINGMKQYNMNQSDVKEGDYFIYPGDISLQGVDKNINLIIIDKKWKEADFLTLFSGNNFASMYYSDIDRVPWCLSKKPIDTIFICKIELQKNDSIYKNK